MSKAARKMIEQVQTALHVIEGAQQTLDEIRNKYKHRAILLSQKAKVCPVFRDRSPMNPDAIEVVEDGIKLTWKNPTGPDETFTAIWKTLDNDFAK